MPQASQADQSLHFDELNALLAEIRTTFAADFEQMQVDDTELSVLTIRNMQAHLDTILKIPAAADPLTLLPLWAKVWPGSFVLGRFLRKFEPEGKSLLELGAGCGILSLVAARYPFARIVLSDIVEDALRFARANVLRNNLAERVEVCRLDVTSPGRDPRFAGGFDRIAASELLYLDALHRPLLNFVERHLAPAGMAFFCTDAARAKPRFAKAAAKIFKIQEGRLGVISRDEDGTEQRRLYNILILERP